MPRKKDGLPYEVHPTPAKGQDGRNIVYVRPASGMKVDMKELEAFCRRNGYGLREGELSLVFGAFMRVASELMAMGYRVETTLGSFAPKLALRREITNPDEVHNNDVVLEGVEYKPGKRWKKEIGEWLTHGFRKEYTPDVQALMANREHLEQALKESLKEGYTTVKRFAEQAHLSHYSARKQLNEWTKGEKPKLLLTRMGQLHIYTET